ncbi:MAG TPA: PIG-L family deacetylase [Candidatus Sulfotelmatobacter sp.]|jgi:LmbE family N-acetylglucosaminyl deacetylase|nr:PIG-L family deacetylase [Candidatus Sulfotelmatobacter sp.]
MNWNINNKNNPNSLLIVAHPDDETIFCGGTLLSYPNWNWSVVCLTMQMNTPRPEELRKAMELYKNSGVNITSFLSLQKTDEGQPLSETDIDDWKNSIQKLSLSPDIVFTHNSMGEYGHEHHKGVNKIVHDLFSNVWDFVYPGDINITPQPTKSTVNSVGLTHEILKKKKEIFEKAYVTQFGLWNVLKGLMEYEFTKGPELFTQ